MKKRVGVLTDDEILFCKIRLLLREAADVSLLTKEAHPSGYDLVLHDERYFTPEYDSVGIGDRGDIPLCFLHGDLLMLLENTEGARQNTLTLSQSGRRAYLFGEEIKLTEVEYKLLERLVAASPDFVSRAELLQSVWGGECDTGVVNVYVHYLRQKLERSGNKVIISSRKFGYKIDEKYVKGVEK